MEKDNSNIKKQRAFGPFVFSVDEIRPHLLVPGMNEQEIVHSIKEMSTKFTKRRDQIADYVLDERHVSSYASFYLPTNIPKLHFLYSHLSNDVLNDFLNRPFIDIGSGPGTFSLAHKSLLEINDDVEMIAVDSSELMLKQASKIMSGFFPKQKFQTQRKFLEKRSDGILFFGHSINEMGVSRAQDLIMMVDPEYVMWIEPGTSELFPELKKLRAQLLDSYDILYPCPGNEACPSSWCHQVLRTSHDLSVERLSQLVSLDRKILPMTAHAYRRKRDNENLHSPITIQFLNETKFSFEYSVCMRNENNENRIHTIEIQKKQLTKEQEKAFKNANVGDRLNFDIEKIVQEKLRVKLNNL